MKSINLYTLAIMDKMKYYPLYYSALSDENQRVYKPHEANSLKVLVENMINGGASLKSLDGFYYGFIIPQIGKEFDTLKISDKVILNVELKSYIKNLDDVKDQLVKNKFYLAHLGGKHYFYTFNSNDNKVYKLNEQNKLENCEIEEIISINNEIKDYKEGEIDSLFSLSRFMVSPIKEPERFLKGEYFLTQQQQLIKKKITASIYGKQSSIVKLSGSPGTGKTLLLYDMALTFAVNRKIAFVIWGEKAESHYIFERLTKNIVFIPVDNVDKINSGNFDLVITDETQRYSEKQFNIVVNFTKKRGNRGIIAFEKQDVVFDANGNLTDKRMKSIRGANYILSGRIRVNSCVHSFITKMFDKNIMTKKCGYSAVNVHFSKNKEETDDLINLYKEKGYTYIYTSKEYGNIDERDVESFLTVGREFSNVVVVIDEKYYYNNNNKLCKKEKFPNMLYQAVTRARGKLTVIIKDNEELFNYLLKIKCKK